MPFTDAEKLEAAEREVKYRRKVYPRLVANGRMSQANADRQTAIMAEIADDYRSKSQLALAAVDTGNKS